MTNPTRYGRRLIPLLLGSTSLVMTAGVAMAQSGETITASSPYEIISLNPTGSTGADLGTALTSKAMFDTLVTRNAQEFEPSLATEWNVSEDGTSYTFTLRDDVAFHDGSSLTAADVVASIALISDTPGPLASLWQPVTADANGDYEVTLSLEEPYGALLSNLSQLEIMPAALIEDESFWNAPVGSGPFVFESFTSGQELRVTANPDYWGGAPEVENLVFRVIPEISSRLAALETGEIDVTWNVPDDLLSALQNNPDMTVETVTSLSSYVLWFNPQEGPLSDVRVRQAMWHAIDVEKLVSILHPFSGKVADAAVTPEVLGYAPQTPYEYDPEVAQALLADAGYPDGIDLSVQFSRPEFRPFVDAMISEWDKVGIRVTANEKESAVWLDDLLALNWEMNFMGQAATTGDADYLLGRLYPCDAERIGYCNPELDEILEAASEETEPAARVALYDEAQQIIYDDAVGIYPMDQLIPYVWRNRLSGFEPDPNFVPDFATVSVEN